MFTYEKWISMLLCYDIVGIFMSQLMVVAILLLSELFENERKEYPVNQ